MVVGKISSGIDFGQGKYSEKESPLHKQLNCYFSIGFDWYEMHSTLNSFPWVLPKNCWCITATRLFMTVSLT